MTSPALRGFKVDAGDYLLEAETATKQTCTAVGCSVAGWFQCLTACFTQEEKIPICFDYDANLR